MTLKLYFINQQKLPVASKLLHIRGNTLGGTGGVIVVSLQGTDNDFGTDCGTLVVVPGKAMCMIPTN